MRKFLIDTDTAADDAAALVYMLRENDIRVLAITTVSGNVPLDKATKNALSSIEASGTYSPPVYAGCSMPILKKPFYATNVHGNDGLGDSGIVPSRLHVEKGHGVDAIINTILENPHEIELLALGPLTNLAIAYLKCPKISSLLKNVVIMGGSGFEKGNVTEYAEFNIFVDAEAAKIVVSSGMPITLVGCELSTDECGINAKEAELLDSSTDHASNYISAVTKKLRAFDLETYARDEIFLPDAVAAAIAVDSSVSSKIVPVFADVEIKDDVRYGQIIMDDKSENPNVKLAYKLDNVRFKSMFFSNVTRIGYE